MGNRAVITTPEKKIGVYLHWNGGRDSVEAFLDYCKLRGFRAPDEDDYGWARLCQVIGNFFGGCLSIGIDRYDRLDRDNGDNGVYVIKGWKIVKRIYCHGEQDNYDHADMLHAIDAAQPERDRLGAWLDSIEIPVSQLRLGDKVYMQSFEEAPKAYEVIGFGTHDAVNGRGYLGMPYVGVYGDNPEDNGNNYPHIYGETCRIVPRV